MRSECSRNRRSLGLVSHREFRSLTAQAGSLHRPVTAGAWTESTAVPLNQQMLGFLLLLPEFTTSSESSLARGGSPAGILALCGPSRPSTRLQS